MKKKATMFENFRVPIRGLLQPSLLSLCMFCFTLLIINILASRFFSQGSDVTITEFLASNQNGLTDENDSAEDWIELHNKGNIAVDLAGWSLSDDEENPGKWVFPSVVLGPGEHLVLFASGKDRQFPVGEDKMHVNFSLDRFGEHLGLYTKELPRVMAGGIIGNYPEQSNGYSFGLDQAGDWRYFMTPTPGSGNSTTDIIGSVAPVIFSVTRGHYNDPISLTLTTRTEEAEIRYTIDGSAPTRTNGLVYNDPFSIFSTTSLRAAAFREDYVPSQVSTHTYFFNLRAALSSLPIMAITIDVNDFHGQTGIIGIKGGSRSRSSSWVADDSDDYFNLMMRGREWEKPVSVEYFDPESNFNSRRMFQIDAGMRVHGGNFARARFRPGMDGRPREKISYRLYFRGAYGSSSLRFPLFEDSSVEEFDQLVLRAGMNDRVNPFIRDELVRRLYRDMGQVSAHGSLVNFFINGFYKGYYNPTERIRSSFMQAHHGGSEGWDVVGIGDFSGDDFEEFQEGDDIEWKALFDLLREDVTEPAVYLKIEQKLDLVNFVDYLLINVYCAMGDWPQKNWLAGRDRGPNGIYRFYAWDAEWALGGFGEGGRRIGFNSFTSSGLQPQTSGLSSPVTFSNLYQRLKLSAELRLLFADRVNKHFFNEGALTETNIRQRHDELAAELSRVFDGQERRPAEMNPFIRDTWAPERQSILFRQMNAEGLLADAPAPTFNRHGGVIRQGFRLMVSSEQGTVYYTTDGTDPRNRFSGEVSELAKPYVKGESIVLNESTLVKMRALGLGWSALTSAQFSVVSPLGVSESSGS